MPARDTPSTRSGAAARTGPGARAAPRGAPAARRSPARPPTAKGRATRDRVFAAAIKLINARGYEAATIPGICAEAGIAVGSFYHHFRSKSDILLAYVEDESERLLAYYGTLESLSRKKALLACVERFFGFYARKGRGFVSTFLSLLLVEGEAWFRPEGLSIQAIARDCLERGAAAGEFAAGPALGRFVELATATVWDLSCGWCVHGGPEGLAAEAKRRFRRLLDLAAPP